MKEVVDEKNNKIIGNINLDNSKVKFIGSNNVLYRRLDKRGSDGRIFK